MITVLLADDHTMFREGLQCLLESEKDFSIVGQSENGRDAIALATKLHPDVLVMDVIMPQLNGIEAAKQIHRATSGKTKIIFLSAYDDDQYIEKALTIGAAGYILKDTAYETLPEAIRKALKGETSFSPNVNQRITRLREKPVKYRNTEAPYLSRREAEVLQLVAEGHGNKGAAKILGLSIKTIEKHRQRLMDKTGIHETAGLTRYAIATGVIKCTP